MSDSPPVRVDKGKGREPPPPDAEVITVDDDSDADFFTAATVRRAPLKGKRSVRGSQRREATRREALPPATQPTYVGSDSDSDAEHSRARRKRTRNQPRLVPEWAREGSLEGRAERSRSERARSNTATSRASLEPITGSPDKTSPRAKRTATRCKVELTPPPELDEEIKQQIAEQTRLRFQDAIAVDINDDENGDPMPSSSPRPTEGRTKVQITVGMVADPDKKRTGSEAAVKHYERRRVFTVFHDDPLSSLIAALGQRVQKAPDQLVLVYGDQRIFATHRTPADLGIALNGEMRAYELDIYNKIQRMERRERLAQFDKGAELVSDDSPAPEDEPTLDSAAPPAAPEEHKIKVRLQGASGDCLVRATPQEPASTLLRYFCTKTGLDAKLAEKMRLCFDGEYFSGETSLADMDVDGGDLIEVHGP